MRDQEQQMEQGAPIDVFISAAPKHLNALQTKNLLLTDTRKDLLTNEVVLIGHASCSTWGNPKTALAPKDKSGISDFQD